MEPSTSRCSKVSVKRRALAVAIRSSGMPARTKVAPNVSSGEKPGVHLLLVGSKTDFSGNRFIYCRIYYKRLPGIAEAVWFRLCRVRKRLLNNLALRGAL